LAVTGGSIYVLMSTAEPAWFYAHYNIVTLTYLLPSFVLCSSMFFGLILRKTNQFIIMVLEKNVLCIWSLPILHMEKTD